MHSQTGSKNAVCCASASAKVLVALSGSIALNVKNGIFGFDPDDDRMPTFSGSGANFKKGRRADPGALGERESLACQIGPKFKLCTRTAPINILKAEFDNLRASQQRVLLP